MESCFLNTGSSGNGILTISTITFKKPFIQDSSRPQITQPHLHINPVRIAKTMPTSCRPLFECLCFSLVFFFFDLDSRSAADSSESAAF
ncbi:hypothetical protein L596_002425 [Steinernema carpocapsae]|uniref:Uncharacterized protein n=1 Tax=Steinernema carpocapsae TaxID=34508 RepID=A0A4U8UT47_STECR|nr:hypothetical protein L596_002425 [Steinernema carpocapsae]